MDRKWKRIAVLGITGGVGAGKSTVLSCLRDRIGAEIIECDEVGRRLQQEGGPCYEPMLRLFGEQVKRADGSIDRAAVAGMIYTDPGKREQLNRIVHPAVKAEVRRILEAYDAGCGRTISDRCRKAEEEPERCGESAPDRASGRSDPGSGNEEKPRRLAVVEAALLIDDHYEELCDEIWYIYADEETRRRRLKNSRGYSDSRIDRMFQTQRNDASFRRHTRLTIDNTGDFVQNTYRQVEEGLESHFPDLFAGGKQRNPWISAV